MSNLSSVTDILKPTNIPEIRLTSDECKPTRQCDDKSDSYKSDSYKSDSYKSDSYKSDSYKSDSYKDSYKSENDCKSTNTDECGDGRQSWNSAKYNDHSNNYGDSKNYGHSKDDAGWKDAKNDEYQTHKEYGDSKYDGGSKDAKNDDCEQHNKDYGDSRQDGGWKDAKNDNCEHQKDYCQPQSNYCDTKAPEDCGKGTVHYNDSPGDALAKVDFGNSDLALHGPDHSGDLQGALASMSSGHALDYAIGQMGPADHFDVGHFDVPADTSHDAVHHA